MGNLTSTLTISLKDDVSGKAGAAAGALKKLGASGDALKKLAKSSPEAAKLAKDLEKLEAAANKVGALKGAAAGADALGAKLRKARDEVDRTARELAAAEKKVAFFGRSKANNSPNYAGFVASGLVAEADARLKAAKIAHTAAQKSVTATAGAFADQKRVVAGLTAGLAAGGVNVKNLGAAEAALKAQIAGVNAELARQPVLLASAAGAATNLARGMADVGRHQLSAIENSRRLIDGMGAQARAAKALRDEQARLVQVEHARKRASASGDLIAGMGGAGRATAERIAQGRRVSEGMSAPARAAREAAAAALVAETERRKSQQQARDAAAAVAAGATGAALKSGYDKARDGWLEMDEATRRQAVILGLNDESQKPLTAQALQIGKDTRFSNPDVTKAQTRVGSSLPSHLKDPAVIAAITENAKDYALAMGTTMDEGSSAILARMLGLRMDMSTPEAAAASSKTAANRLVQFAKSSGADHNDVMGFTKFGAAPSQVAGFSDSFTDAMAAQLRRNGYEGSMAGNFVRAAATKLAVPTSKGLDALAANGFEHSDYVEKGKELDVGNLDKVMRQKFGSKLNASQTARLHALMQNPDVVGDRDEFVPQASAILSETFGRRTKKGNLHAQDAEKIAKTVNGFLTSSAGAVDIERLMRDLLAKGLTPAMAKYLFGQEHGGRAQALDLKTLEKDEQDFKNTPKNRAQDVGEKIHAGAYGAYQQMTGSIETFWMTLGKVNDVPLTAFATGVGAAVDAVSGLPAPVLQAGSALAGLVGAAVMFKGALGAGRLARDLLGYGGKAGLIASAAALDGSAAALTAAAGRLGLAGATGNAAGAAAAGAAGVAAGGAATATVLGSGAIAGAILADAMPKVMGHGGILSDAESIGAQAARAGEMFRRSDAGKAAAGVIGYARPGQPVSMPEGASSPSSYPTRWEGWRGGLGIQDFLLGRQKNEATLPVPPSMQGASPKVDPSSLEAAKTAAEGTKAAVEGLNLSVAPQVDSSSLAAADQLAGSLLGKLAQIGPAVAGAKAQIGSIATNVPRAGGGNGGGGTAPAAPPTGVARRTLANSFA